MTFTWISERFSALHQPIPRLKISRGNLYGFFSFLTFSFWQFPRCKVWTQLLPLLLWSACEAGSFWYGTRSNLQQSVTQARQENRACHSNPFHSILSLPTAHPTFFLWMSDESLIFYSLFKKPSWHSTCFKPYYILFVWCSLVTILKKKAKQNYKL